MEKRKISSTKPSALPSDYLRMIAEVFTTNFDAGLKAYAELKENPFFEAKGEIFSNEIVVAVSLMTPTSLAAITVYGSADFDPKASAPTLEDLLSSCVDTIGGVFENLLAPERPEMLARLTEASSSSLEGMPLEWTRVLHDNKEIWIRLDRSNLTIDDLANDWLAKNDPEAEERERREQEETEGLFVTGSKVKARSGSGSGAVH